MRFNQVLMHTKLENLCQAHVSQGKAIASRHQKTICSMYLASFSDLLFPAPPTPSRADVDSKKKIDVSAFALCNPMSSATKRSHTKVNISVIKIVVCGVKFPGFKYWLHSLPAVSHLLYPLLSPIYIYLRRSMR